MIDLLIHIIVYVGFVILLGGGIYLTYSYFKIQQEIRKLERKDEQDRSIGI